MADVKGADVKGTDVKGADVKGADVKGAGSKGQLRIATAKVPASRAAAGLPVPASGARLPVPAGGKAARAQVEQLINDYQSDTAEILGQPDPLLARSALFTLMLLVGAALTWAALAHVDRIVMARGKVASAAPTVVVQPLETAIIKTLEARVGDVVKAGAVLATLDPTFNAADVAQLQAKAQSLDAQIARLEAEHQERPFALAAGQDNDYGRLQQGLWSERQSQYTSTLRDYDEKTARARSEITARQRELEQLAEQAKVVGEVETMRRALEERQAGTRLDLLRAREGAIEVRRNIALAKAALQQGLHNVQMAEAEKEIFVKQWKNRLTEDLVARRDERNALLEQLAKARKRLDLVRLVTPVDAVVLETADRSVGSVATAGQPLFTLVPLHAGLEIEAQIPAQDFSHVQVGDPVEIKLDAYPYLEHGMLLGAVETIAADAFTNREAPGTSSIVYKTRIRLVKATLDTAPESFRLVPGMPLSAEIKVGERSVLTYFLRPILRGLNEGLREP